MQLIHRTVTAVRRAAARIHAWRDEIADWPIDHDRWLR